MLVCTEVGVAWLLELGTPTEGLSPTIPSDPDVTILAEPSSIDVSGPRLLPSPILDPPFSPPAAGMETVFRLAVVVNVIEVNSTLPVSCSPMDTKEEAGEEVEEAVRLEKVEALEALEEAEVETEPNPNPVDLEAVDVSVTVTRASVPLSALPAADSPCSLETRPGRAVRSGEAGSAVSGAVFGEEDVGGWESVVVVRTMPGQEAERMWGSSIMVVLVGDCCGWGRLVGFPGEYSVIVSVAGHEGELVVSAVARLPEGGMRRKAAVSRLIHCRVEIIVLRFCEVSAVMVVLIVFSFYPGTRVSVVCRVSIANQYHPA